MNHQAKNYYEKMIDYKRFAMILLAIGAFFYLGVIIPSIAHTMTDIYIMIGTSTVCLAAAIIFFYRSKHFRILLDELENGDQHTIEK